MFFVFFVVRGVFGSLVLEHFQIFTQRVISRGWQDPKIIVDNVSVNIHEHASRDPVVKIFLCE